MILSKEFHQAYLAVVRKKYQAEQIVRDAFIRKETTSEMYRERDKWRLLAMRFNCVYIRANRKPNKFFAA